MNMNGEFKGSFCESMLKDTGDCTDRRYVQERYSNQRCLSYMQVTKKPNFAVTYRRSLAMDGLYTPYHVPPY